MPALLTLTLEAQCNINNGSLTLSAKLPREYIRFPYILLQFVFRKSSLIQDLTIELRCVLA